MAGATAAAVVVLEKPETAETAEPETAGTGLVVEFEAEPPHVEGSASLTEQIEPLREADAPDPFVVVDQNQAWLFTTNTAHGNVPVWTWQDGQLVVTDALPNLPAWAVPGRTWAPAVVQIGDHWVLAFTAATTAGYQCIGIARASAPAGPYVPAQQPLVCDEARGGSIDPSFVVDDAGVTWLLFKDDGNCCGLPTAIRSAPLTADGLALAGEPRVLIGADQSWEGGLVEGPSMAQVDGRWLLLYSANRWDADAYAVGAAWCEGPGGPCTKQHGPILSAGSDLAGPGGAEFIGDASLVAFHAWPQGQVGYAGGASRGLEIGRVVVGAAGDAMVVTGPAVTDGIEGMD